MANHTLCLSFRVFLLFCASSLLYAMWSTNFEYHNFYLSMHWKLCNGQIHTGEFLSQTGFATPFFSIFFFFLSFLFSSIGRLAVGTFLETSQERFERSVSNFLAICGRAKISSRMSFQPDISRDLFRYERYFPCRREH